MSGQGFHVHGPHDHELEHRLLADFVPRPAEGQQAVEHASPAGRHQHD